MDNTLFWKILKSMFGSESEEYKKKVDYMLSWDSSLIGNDLWIKMLKFMQKTYETTKKMPLASVFNAQYPETSWFFETIEGVTDSEALSQLVTIFENACLNKIASLKLQEYSQQVAVNGMTYDGLNELKKYAKIDNNNEKLLSPEQEYEKKIINTTGMKTGISEIDELVSIPKGAVVTIAGFTGSFKCVAANTRINTNRGLMTIESIVNSPSYEDILVLAEDGYRYIYDVHYDGHKPTIKVFVGGRLVETSPVHKFRVIRDKEAVWVEAKDLKINDKVLVKKDFCFKDYKEHKAITFKQYKRILKDSLHKDFSNEFCSKKWASLPFNEECYKDRFGTSVGECEKLGSDLDLFDNKSEIPGFIFTAKPEAQVAYLYAIFQKNGTLSSNGVKIGITSSNYNILNDIATLLCSLETSTRIIKIKDNLWRLVSDSYYGKYDLIRSCSFYDKATRQLKILNITQQEQNYDSVDETIVYKKRTKTQEEEDNFLIYQFVTDVQVNEDGAFLYDISVDGSPTYTANGCVTHNTTTTANIVYRNVYNNGYNFAYISLEVTRFDLMLNLWCLHSLNSKFDKTKKIPTKLARDGKLSEAQKRYLFDVIVPDFEKSSRGKLKILDEGDFKTFSEGEIIRKLEDIDDEFEKKLDGVVLDHANLCKFYSNSENVTEATNRYVSLFRRLSNAFRLDTETHEMRGLTAILLAQTNRTGWHEAAKRGGAYDLTALAEANELERCSSVIMTVFHDKNLTAANELKVCLLKNRYGSPHPEPIITDVYPEYYYVGDKLDGFEYNNENINMDDLYNNKPSDLGLQDYNPFYDSEDFY